MKARQKEVDNLMHRGVFEVVKRSDIPEGANCMKSKFVLTIKSPMNAPDEDKARYTIAGHRDKMKKLIVHTTVTLQPSSIRLLALISEILDLELWISDACQAFLQAAKKLTTVRYIIDPPPEFGIPPDMCLKVVRALYGLTESGDMWYETLDDHHAKDLGMVSSKLDPALYFKVEHSKLVGLSGTYVDDILRAGTPEFRELANKTHERFEMSDDKELPNEFTGFQLDRDPAGTLIIKQTRYLRRLEALPTDASLRQFRSMRMRLAWLSNTRPDCLFSIAQLAQVTEDMFNKNPGALIKQMNKATTYAVKNPCGIKVNKLDLDSLRVVGFSDASFANNHDLTSQVGHIIFLADKNDNVMPIYFKSYKARRVTRSAMASEVIAFADMFDIAVALAADLTTMLGLQIPVQLLTDSKCLFDVISKGIRTSEKRIMIDITAARNAFKSTVISDIGLVRSADNIADGLTKDMQQASLRSMMSTGKFDIRPVQWIVRPSNPIPSAALPELKKPTTSS